MVVGLNRATYGLDQMYHHSSICPDLYLQDCLNILVLHIPEGLLPHCDPKASFGPHVQLLRRCREILSEVLEFSFLGKMGKQLCILAAKTTPHPLLCAFSQINVLGFKIVPGRGARESHPHYSLALLGICFLL